MTENVENYPGQDSNISEGAEPCDNSCTQCDSSTNQTSAGEPVRQTTFEEQGHFLREQIKEVAVHAKEYIQRAKETTPAGGDDSIRRNHSEMIANATLSYRHLEDAAMRIGKCLQANSGGVSILDKMRDEQEANETTNDAPAADTSCDTETCGESPEGE